MVVRSAGRGNAGSPRRPTVGSPPKALVVVSKRVVLQEGRVARGADERERVVYAEPS